MRTTKLAGRKSVGHILLAGAIASAPLILPAVAHAGKSKVLYSFGPKTDGNFPLSGVIRGPDGTLYGTTEGGGDLNYCFHEGCGTIYKITPQGNEVILHVFDDSEGDYPFREPAMDSQGNLYVTTCCGNYYDLYGSVVKLTPDGTYTKLYSFKDGDDGGSPNNVTVDANGNLYGVALIGGAYGKGVLYEITSKGQYQVLHAFGGGDDGSVPNGTLALDKNGNVFGTTEYDGANGCGTIYEVTSKGKKKVLYSFGAFPDGCYPLAGVAQDDDGNLYGTTWEGGNYRYGTLYELSASGTYTVLHSFGDTDDGLSPDGPPTPVKNAYGKTELYGTTTGTGNGLSEGGVLYKYSHKAHYRIIYDFMSHALDPDHPEGLLAAGPNGKFYGASNAGGANCVAYGGCGTVFEVRTH